MTADYRKFYRGFYMNTGCIPTSPFNQNVYPGDFFQIRNGSLIVLGNIYRNGIVGNQEASFKKITAHNSQQWHISDGVTKAYSGREKGSNPIDGDFEYSKQILAFNSAGSYFFKGNSPESVKISNWEEIRDSLIIKLTQTMYSFRELYVATECFTTSDWTLAIAGSDSAELELATESETFGLGDLFGDVSTKTIQSRDIEYYNREEKRRPQFFKAKKLVVQEDRFNTFINDLITYRQDVHEWANNFYDLDFFEQVEAPTQGITYHDQLNVLDMLQANELNPNTALLYFKWANADLNDIEKLFMCYEY